VNAVIVPPVLLTPAHDSVVRLAEKVASTLSSFATALRTPQTGVQLAAILAAARELPGRQNSASDALVRADESLMLNPRRARYRERLEHDRDLLESLGTLVTRVTGMARALHDNYNSRLVDDAFVALIALELDRAAHDLLLLARDAPRVEPAPITTEPPALTAPLTIASPDPDNWILVGSLLEDLRRVREVIIGEDAA